MPLNENDIKITVLMPAYNAAAHIATAIGSVLDQSMRDFELLMIDDGSTDATLQIIRNFDDERIRVHSQPNAGIAAALNTGLSLAKAPLIARFDADDFCFSNRLQRQYDFMQQHPEYSIVGCTAAYTDLANDFVFHYAPAGMTNDEIQKVKYQHCPFIHSGVMYHKDAVINAGGYNIHAHSFEDHLVWIKLLEKHKGHNLDDTLIRVRLHPGSMTMDEKWRRKRFTQIKKQAIISGTIDEKQGKELLELMKEQDCELVRTGSYHSLLAKKYLWDNHQPGKVRENIRKVLKGQPMHMNSYLLWLMSWFPGNIIRRVYQLSKRRTAV